MQERGSYLVMLTIMWWRSSVFDVDRGHGCDDDENFNTRERFKAKEGRVSVAS